MIHWLLRRIKRRHNALWVNVRWLEPFGDARWAVIAHRHDVRFNAECEVSRSSSLVVALWRAFTHPCGRCLSPADEGITRIGQKNAAFFRRSDT